MTEQEIREDERTQILKEMAGKLGKLYDSPIKAREYGDGVQWCIDFIKGRKNASLKVAHLSGDVELITIVNKQAELINAVNELFDRLRRYL